ncbi:MFS transporter [Roseomonas sp. E05]|uniref:MFS transporter n=1 Tax=Roseomonas sp. E05 TaxID=3046310 RepID=UPI0024BB6E2E|nr:MFS transporter [Roseomonas sp. E05]MDJ0389972.1 MFS transporter [Roseomonas sp. E05]
MTIPDERRWAVLALVFAARVVMAAQLQSVGALGAALLDDPALGLGYGTLGLLIGAYLLPGIFVALPAGQLALRLGERRMVLLGLGLVILGGLGLPLAPDIGMALAARTVSGAGGALLNVALSAMVMRRFQGASLAPAMGVFLAGYPLGLAGALVTLPLGAAAFSWRAALMVLMVPAGLTFGAAALLLDRRRSLASAGRQVAGSTAMLGLAAGEMAPVAAAGVAWGAHNAAFAILLGFAPALLVEQGASAGMAGAVASLVGWISIPLLPFGGAIMERTGHPQGASMACLFSAALVVVALMAGTLPPVAAMLAAGLLLTPPAAVLVSLPARVVPAERQPRAMGLFYTLFYACMAVLPPLAGLSRDASDFQAAPILVAAALLAAAGLALTAYGASAARLRPGPADPGPVIPRR